MKLSDKKLENAILECYVELYKNSIPSTDFNELMNNATLNEKGQKIIDYNCCEIENDKMIEIVESIIKKYKIKSWQEKMFSNTIYLGCSPKTKIYM